MTKGENKPKFEHEDWCNSCRDGGELVMCYRCPRGNLFAPAMSRVSLTSLDSVSSQVLWLYQSTCSSDPHDDVQSAQVSYVF